jgi:hypothetical protein
MVTTATIVTKGSKVNIATALTKITMVSKVPCHEIMEDHPVTSLLS